MYGTLLKPLPVPKLEKLRLAAQLFNCVLCHRDKQFTVAAHCNDVEWKGIGKKAPGWMLAYICGKCHDLTDGRSGALSKEDKRALWDLAFKRTVAIWFQEGLVKVS